MLEYWSYTTVPVKHIKLYKLNYSHFKLSSLKELTTELTKNFNQLPITIFTVRNLVFMVTFQTKSDQENKTAEQIDFHLFDPSQNSLKLIQENQHFHGPIGIPDCLDCQLISLSFYK